MPDPAYEETIRTTTVGDCIARGWRVGLCCRTCGYDGGCSRSRDVTELRELPPDLTMQDLAERVVMPCGRKGAWVGFSADLAATHRGYAGK